MPNRTAVAPVSVLQQGWNLGHQERSPVHQVTIGGVYVCHVVCWENMEVVDRTPDPVSVLGTQAVSTAVS